jgi:radical SAM superfamily enzyme YgiQ (UPF0313 family)
MALWGSGVRIPSAPPSGWAVTVLDEKVERVDGEQEADLVGLTAMTCSANRAYAIAERFRQRGVPVVMGGIHASSLPSEALRHCDSVVVGEAEQLWPRVYRGKGYLPVHFVETTRGCPLDCEFCAVTTFFGGRYRNRPLQEVLGELRGLRPFEGFVIPNVVFFVDDNIISNRGYAREFLTRIADLGLRWLGHASVNLANDRELLALCQRSGCTSD